jgi:hypothetical protein
MKSNLVILSLAICLLLSCNNQTKQSSPALSLNGTWKLVSGYTVTKGVVSTAEYPKDQDMIKIFDDTHFAFLNQTLNTPKDSSNKFDAGGGKYTLKGDQYTEHLDYYKDKHIEGQSFNFTVTIKNDTLIQTGIEKVEAANINRTIVEKYLRVKN